MSDMKRSVCILLTAVIMLSLLVSCGNNENPVNQSDDTASENLTDSGENSGEITTDSTSKWVREPINLPEMNFDSREFNIITIEVASPNRMYDLFLAEEQTGEPVNDAMYVRKTNVEEKFNVVLNHTQIGDPSATAKKSIIAGDTEYDLIVDTMSRMKDLAGAKVLTDLYTMPYIADDLDKPWWDQAVIRDLSVNGKLYFAAGDIVLRDKLRLSCIYFNKDMYQSLGLDYPYQFVYDGTWTIDKLMDITKNVNQDLNGDGLMDQYDQWGFMSQYEFGLHLYEASGEKTVSVDKDGVPQITMNSPRSLDVILKILSVCAEPEVMFYADTIKGADDIWIKASDYFQEDRFLMRASVFEPIARDLRAMPTDFGVLPTPKFNEQQENYYTYAEMSALVIGVPSNADLEFSGLITEALAYESSTTIMPAFYDLCLMSKSLRDNESEGMLDIIFNSKVYDIGYIYGVGSMSGMLSDLIKAGSTDFVSRFEKAQGTIDKALQKFIDSYE